MKQENKLYWLLLFLIFVALAGCGNDTFISGNTKENEYKEKHDKYRTLMYRTNFEKCFVDSCRKYGLLYEASLGIKETDFTSVDTIPVNEPAFCK